MVGNRQPRNGFFRGAENSGASSADSLTPIVHTAMHSIRRLNKLPVNETA
jgi:hypothetical protein